MGAFTKRIRKNKFHGPKPIKTENCLHSAALAAKGGGEDGTIDDFSQQDSIVGIFHHKPVSKYGDSRQF